METYGPALPPGFKLDADSDSEEKCDPPSKKAKIIGPQFPAFLAKKYDSDEDSVSSEKSDKSNTINVIGPVLPPYLSNEDVEDRSEVYGPLPPQTKMDYNIVSIIEKRAASMKDKLEMKGAPAAETTQREEWMVVPDTSRRNQLGAISRCLAPGSKIERKETTDLYKNPEEDEKTAEELKKYNKSKRAESLVDLHTKKRKKDKKEKKSSKSKERKAFDRDEIAVKNFTQKQVNSVIDKAKYLNSRFAPGRSSQYL